MSCDAEYILNAAQRENSSLLNDLEHMRREAARLLLERDEAREFCLRLANAVHLCLYEDGNKQIIEEILGEYFSNVAPKPREGK